MRAKRPVFRAITIVTSWVVSVAAVHLSLAEQSLEREPSGVIGKGAPGSLPSVEAILSPFAPPQRPRVMGKQDRPRAYPLSGPRLSVTLIDLVPDPSGFIVAFSWSNAGNVALPPAHELPQPPDYRVLVDGTEIDRGDLVVPENPVAAPGYSARIKSRGFLGYVRPRNYYFNWSIGKQITIILNERNVLGMGSSSKTSSLRAVALLRGYDLELVSVTFDWATCTAQALITRVGTRQVPLNPAVYADKIDIGWYVTGYHPRDDLSGSFNQGTVAWGEGPFQRSVHEGIPQTTTFPHIHRLKMPGPYSLFYEITVYITPNAEDEIDGTNNTIHVRFNRPQIPPGPRIDTCRGQRLLNARGKEIVRLTVNLLNEEPVPSSGLRMVLKKNGSTLKEILPLAVAAKGRLTDGYVDTRPGGKDTRYDVYLYNARGQMLDAKDFSRF